MIGDHGSTTFYSAATNRMTLLAATGLDELDPASPTAAFARQTPRLDSRGDLYAQLLSAEQEFDPKALQPLIDAQLAEVNRSAVLTREHMYGLLNIPPPATPPASDPVPPPRPQEGRPPTTYDVTGTAHVDGTVEVQRRPVIQGHHREARGFYAAAVEQSHPCWRDSAEVVARTATDAATDVPAAEWLLTAPDDFPDQDVLVAAVDNACALVRLREGLVLEAHTQRPWGTARPPLDPLLLGSAIHLWLVAGGTQARLVEGLLIRTGRRHVQVSFRPAPHSS